MIQFTVDTKGADRWLTTFGSRHVPYAAARALTKTAQDAQAEVRRQLPRRFTIRNTFVEKGVRIKPARYRDNPIQATVWDKDDFMRKQEDGGTHKPKSGRNLAIPTWKARRNKKDIITKANRPRQLLNKKYYFKITENTPNRQAHGFEPGVYKRTGKGKFTKLFSFAPSAKLEKRFDFVDTVLRTAERNVIPHFNRFMVEAIRTAR